MSFYCNIADIIRPIAFLNEKTETTLLRQGSAANEVTNKMNGKFMTFYFDTHGTQQNGLNGIYVYWLGHRTVQNDGTYCPHIGRCSLLGMRYMHRRTMCYYPPSKHFHSALSPSRQSKCFDVFSLCAVVEQCDARTSSSPVVLPIDTSSPHRSKHTTSPDHLVVCPYQTIRHYPENGNISLHGSAKLNRNYLMFFNCTGQIHTVM